MKILLKNCRCFHYSPSPVTSVVHIEITDRTITNIFDALPADVSSYDRTYDLTGLEVFPGSIDPHVHLSYVQGNKAISADSFNTGSLAAIAGGTTTVMDFVEPCGSALETIQKRVNTAKSEKCFVDYAFHFSIANVQQINLIEQAAKIERSFKIYTVYNGLKIDAAADLHQVLSEISKHKCIAMIHCENDQVIAQNIPKVKSIEEMSTVRPTWNELEATTRVLTLAELTNCSIHIAHVSLADQVRIINVYKNRYNNGKVTCEITGHHFTLNNGLYWTHAHKEDLVMSPPLQSEKDVLELQQLLREGQIDYTCSDHCPFTRRQRNGDFAPFQAEETKAERKFYEMPGGTNGIQVRFIATYSTLKSANCSLEQISKQTSENVAERFQLPLKGRIQVGFDADLVVVNPYLDTIFSENVRKERMDCSLFNDMKFSGKIEKVFVRGKEFGVDQLEEGSYLRKLL
ncbi:Dihydropyrimidinase [Hexamita inflata]|uniref:dihydropyrimidinase n=1 Tax=Hexamita inflata TaxID=28002 RepID=A0ABP1L1R7_9EUKA